MGVNYIKEVKYAEENVGIFPILVPNLKHGFSWGKGSQSMMFDKENSVNSKINTMKFFTKAGLGKPKESINIVPEHADRICFFENVGDLKSVRVSPVAMNVDCDALFTTCPEITLSVKPADCTVAIIYSTLADGRRLIGLVHSGWRGANIGLPGKSVSFLRNRFDINYKDTFVCIVPHIKKAHRKLEDLSKFNKPEDFKQYFSYVDGVRHFDEFQSNLDQFVESGIDQENIYVYDIDTYEAMERGEGFSYKYWYDMNKKGKTVENGRFIVAVRL